MRASNRLNGIIITYENLIILSIEVIYGLKLPALRLNA